MNIEEFKEKLNNWDMDVFEPNEIGYIKVKQYGNLIARIHPTKVGMLTTDIEAFKDLHPTYRQDILNILTEFANTDILDRSVCIPHKIVNTISDLVAELVESYDLKHVVDMSAIVSHLYGEALEKIKEDNEFNYKE